MDNKRLRKAVHKTLDDLAPLLFLLAIVAVALVLMGLYVWLGVWCVPVLVVAAICVAFLNNYLKTAT
jgi:mannose/fructose/N-acetylgalactosamine-specific phosphotransferase system component IID